MKRFICAHCGSQISKNGLLTIWEQTEALQNVVSREAFRKELAKVHPFVRCFCCDAADNFLVRADLADELSETDDVAGLDERNQRELYSDYA